jgi:hypothetical protein
MKKLFLNSIPYAFILTGFLIIYLFMADVHQSSRENNVYTRFTACVLSVAPAIRSDKSIDNCWNTVTGDTGTSPKRYNTNGY